MEVPIYWKSRISDIEETVKNIKKGESEILGYSAGNRPIYKISYGKTDTYERQANYSSAIGARDIGCYKKNTVPHILIIGEIHGGEWDGIVSCINLINIFETGKDLRGAEYANLYKWQEEASIAIIPALNPDGRARIDLDTVVGMSRDEFRRVDQGINFDDTNCEWPGVKRVHPIKDKVKFMGGYFNDNGINLMHDNFFSPMANETVIALKLADEFAPDMVFNMHGHGGMGKGHIVPCDHSPYLTDDWLKFEKMYMNKISKKGYEFDCYVSCHYDDYKALKKPYFCFDDAVHLSSGAMVATFESDQGVIYQEGDELKLNNRHERIYEKQMMLYETIREFTNEMYKAKQ